MKCYLTNQLNRDNIDDKEVMYLTVGEFYNTIMQYIIIHVKEN